MSRRTWIACAIVLLLLAGAGLLLRPQAAFAGWLLAWAFCLQLGLGALTLVLVGRLAGGAWREQLGPPLVWIASVLPALVLAGLPLLAGLGRLYPWARSEALAVDATLAAQDWYLAPGPLALRYLVAAALWTWMALRIARARPLRTGAAVAFALLHLLAVTAWSIDWIMSLVPEFRSTSFGLRALATQALGACALALLLAPAHPLERVRRSAAKLLLMLVLAWAYLAMMGYVTIYAADLPPEIAWLLPRQRGGWGSVGLLAVVAIAGLPFLALLSARVRDGAGLRAVAGCILAGLLVFAVWQVLPVVAAPAAEALAWALPALLAAAAALAAAAPRPGERVPEREAKR
ncbi:hypothetical protein [Coralloluteibacterium stylophorae]|uniref:Quinol:cytochrome C oxidoreductase n=1 Tax=Coralloluteibacterium stylophorae TaxID=1776034 RepID=A0AAP2C9N2_9GAMM|nr:hypothetical protein [Coralloluteibacterium stylophorae]MBS7456395.1 hypothetical protein [Coralloluteibacterium stylophorae]